MLPPHASASMRSESYLLQNRSRAILRLDGPLSKGIQAQQIRNLRLGIWSSYLHSNLEKEIHRYHGVLKHKNEDVNHKVPWDYQYLRSTRRPGLKGFMCSAWRASNSWQPAPWIADQSSKGSEKETQKSQGRGIEDVEQSALDQLLSNRDGMYDFIKTKSGILGHKWSRAIFPSENITKDSAASTASTSAEKGSAYGTEGFRRRFQGQTKDNLEPEYEIDPITNRKVFKNKTAKLTDPSRQHVEFPTKIFTAFRSQSGESTPLDEALHKQTASAPHIPTRKLPISWDTGVGESNSQPCQNTVLRNENQAFPSKRSEVVQIDHLDYDKHNTYEAFRFNEPDGKVRDEVASENDGLKEFDNRTSYGAFRFREPDGKIETSAPPDPVQSELDKFDKENPYDACRHSQTHGRERDPSRRYSSSIDTREDLDLLRSSDVRASSGIIRRPREESGQDKLAKRKALEDEFQRAHAQEAAYAEELATVRKRKQIQKIAQDLRNENSELQNHVAHARGRVNARIAELEAETLSDVTGKATPSQNDSSDVYERKVQRAENEYVVNLSDMESTARIQTSLDRTLSAGRESRSVHKISIAEFEKDLYSRRPQGLETSYAEEVASIKAPKAREPEEAVLLEAERDPYSKKPMGLETNFVEERVKIADHEAEKDPYSKEPTGLETHYIEECARISQREVERDPYSKEPMGLETSYAEECAQLGEKPKDVVFTCYEPSATNDSASGKLAPTTVEEKHRRKQWFRQKDKELVQEVRTIYEDSYGAIDSKHRQPSEPIKAVPEEPSSTGTMATRQTYKVAEQEPPTLYKILAYDATMQSISEASTTSIVNDSASALTPAEALLRLSNPAKFFPYFEPLKREGYEIVSGSGDVLVFRRVRPAEAAPELSREQNRKTVNPIDGMETIPATGNFASPTGFVNHDVYSNSEPPFKSNIDVRREEPVFSGKPNWKDGSDERGRQKKGKAKRLIIGAAWVGACSYAIGVVAEFFRTGGLDGRGPQGF